MSNDPLSASDPAGQGARLIELDSVLARGRGSAGGLPVDEQTLLDLVDGGRTVRAIVSASGLSGFVAMHRLRSLADRNLVEVTGSGPAGGRAGRENHTMDLSAALMAAAELIHDKKTQATRDTDPVVRLAPAVEPRRETPRGFPLAAQPIAPVVTRGSTPARAMALGAVTATPVPPAPRARVVSPAGDPGRNTRPRGVTPTPGPPAESAGGPVPTLIQREESKSTRVFRLGRYEVLLRIAQGASGSVYLCRRMGASGFARLCVLKVVRQHAKETESVIRSLLREARIGSILFHPNISNVQDVGTYEDQPFLVLDYISGASLGELLAAQAQPPPGVLVSVILDVLSGLHWAHQQTDGEGAAMNLVHCDVCPENIIVGEDGQARIADFGSASFKGDTLAEADRPTVGKPAYTAPERLTGDPVDGRTDVFSVGVVMWNALTGQNLFAAEAFEQVVMNVMQKRIPAPSEFGAPAALNEVCLRALHRAREGRFASAEEMRAALHQAAGPGLLASRLEVGQFVRRIAREALEERRRMANLRVAPADDEPGPEPVPDKPAPPLRTGTQILLPAGRSASTTDKRPVVTTPGLDGESAPLVPPRKLWLGILALGLAAAVAALGVFLVRRLL